MSFILKLLTITNSIFKFSNINENVKEVVKFK